MVSEFLGLEEAIKNSDLVLTGEGKLDHQSFYGKVPVSVAKLAKKYGKPVILIAGSVIQNEDLLNKAGFFSVHSLITNAGSLEKAIGNAGSLIEAISSRALVSFQNT